MNISDNLYLHGLNLLPQFGPKRLLKISNHFGSFQKAWSANLPELLAAGLEPEVAGAFLAKRPLINLELEAKKLADEEIYIISEKDSSYPLLLKEIPSRPQILYYKGTMNNPEELSLAVVGTRKISTYGRSVLPSLLEPLIERGITITSGLAYGVDSEAHKLAVIKGGRTIALLGCGIDSKTIYPRNHVLLADEIINSGGAILSEYPPGTPALKQHFIARNRIISGMSVGTLVVECGLKSGTLITAQHALDQNRAVYAVPGPIYSETSQGPNNIIKMGGRLVTEAGDILQDLNISETPETKITTADTMEEKMLLDLLATQPQHSDMLVQVSGLDAGMVTTTLTFLEMKGKIRNVGGSQYIRVR